MALASDLGTEKIPKLLVKQAIPASVGFLIMSIYTVVDTIYVGRAVGSLGIAAITVVAPISFLISSIGMAIGIGGSSIISRALGANDGDKAQYTFANQITLTVILSLFFMVMGYVFSEEILSSFGAKGQILAYAKSYFEIILYGVPFLAWAMMANNVIRAEGRPKIAMFTLIIPAVVNIILDPILIFGFEMGLAGAAWATTVSYILSAIYTVLYFASNKSQIKIHRHYLALKSSIVKEIAAIGSISLARQATISLMAIVLHNALFRYAGETGVAAFGIVNRVMMFSIFPIMGVVQGFIPITGYNFGAQKMDRVRSVIKVSIKYGTVISALVLLCVLLLPITIVSVFTPDVELRAQAAQALVIVYFASPLISIQLISSAYFQAIGKPKPALFLALTKQGFFLIPLILVLPTYYGVMGIWYAFPLADIFAATVCFWYLKRESRLSQMEVQSITA